jgi:hypothetical protein
MMARCNRAAVVIGLTCSFGLAPLAGGCANLPGGRGAQSAALTDPAVAPAAAIMPKRHRTLDALISPTAGAAGGGYLIGASRAKVDQKKTDEAKQASDRAAKNPASENDALNADTADLNQDGFVTLDEVIAMQRAGLTDREMIDRLRRTDQIFELSPQQQNYLRDRGITRRVIEAMLNMNQREPAREVARPASALPPSDRVSEPATAPIGATGC